MGIQQRVDRKLKEIDELFEEDEAIELPPIAWQPYKGKPQELAYYSSAQDLLYGGEPGGGKAI